MGVIRVEHNANYTTMANFHLRDKRLSLRAIGLMSKMLSLPDDWDYTVVGLAGICREGREAVRKVLQELEETGYLTREQARAGGHFSGYDYTLHEMPQLPAEEASREQEEPPPLPGNLGDGEAPSPRFPVPGIPVPGNPSQLSTIDQRTKEEIPPKPPRGRRRVKDHCDWEPEIFERFWNAYPRGEDKAGARYEWDQIRPDPELMRKMSAALARWKQTDEWLRGVGVPYACRWLRDRRWEWELKPRPLKNKAPDEKEREDEIEWEN